MMIRAGVIVLLFVVYQLWGTGVHTDRAQQNLGAKFEAAKAANNTSPEDDGQKTTATTDAAQSSDTTTSITSKTVEPVTAPTDIEPPALGDAVGEITIPAIGAQFYIVEGVTLDLLTEGPGHFPNTPLPGQPGNAALAGHRVTYKAPFNRIDELKPGDEVIVETIQGTFHYEVLPQQGAPGSEPTSHYIVKPNQTEILDDKGDNRLTLMACHPKYSAAERIVVEAKLVSPPAPPTPIPDAAEPAEELPVEMVLAGNDPSARLPAALWILALATFWFATWYVAQHHRPFRGFKWLTYAIALVPFGFLLYAVFENVTRLLPGAF